MTRAILPAIVAALALTACGGNDPNRNPTTEGAAVSGVAANDLARQARRLKRALDADVTVVNTGSELIVSMPDSLLFGAGSPALSPGVQADLAVLAASLQDYQGTLVEVVGHTDNIGEATLNQDLSLRRAGAVRAVLVANGVASGRIRATGAGESQPVATNLTPEGRALNRRVDVVIRPVSGA